MNGFHFACSGCTGTTGMPQSTFVWNGIVRYDTVSLIEDIAAALGRLYRRHKALIGR